MWEIISRRESLLSRVMMGKYESRLWGAEPNRTDSPSLAVVQDGAENLKSILRWLINQGKEVDVLDHAWILDRSIATWPTFVNVWETEGRTVDMFLTENRHWNITRLKECFGEELVSRIVQLPIGQGERDMPELTNPLAGRTITAQVYSKLFGNADHKHSWLRHLHLQPRERFFWWRILEDAIPSRDWLQRHTLTDDLECPRGCRVVEDHAHITFGCSKITEILDILDSWGFRLPRFTSSADLAEWITKPTADTMALVRLYCGVIYRNWRNRNEHVHGRVAGSPTSTAATILGNITKTKDFTFMETWSTNQPARLSSNLFWCPPPLRDG